MPAYEQTCKECQQAKDGMLRVVKLEEKRSDVSDSAVTVLFDPLEVLEVTTIGLTPLRPPRRLC